MRNSASNFASLGVEMVYWWANPFPVGAIAHTLKVIVRKGIGIVQ